MEELEVLESIYLDDIKVIRDDRDFPVSVQLQLHPATGDELDKRYVCMTLMLNIPEQYPNEVPEIVITNPRGLADEEVQSLLQEIEKLAEERVGGEMLYDVIELAKESLTEGNVPYCPCTICCEHFTEDDVFTKTDCYHYFHNHCLQRYIEHQLVAIQLEKDGKVQHTETKEEDYKIKCPVCREEINCDLEYLQSEVYDNSKDELVYQPSRDMKTWQKNMVELYQKQKGQGGIIDVEAEKNRYLLTDSDNEIQIIPTENKDQVVEAQKNKETEDSRSKPSQPFKFNHSPGRGRNDRKPHFQNHRYGEKYDRNRPSSGSRGYSRGSYSKPFSGRRQQDREQAGFQRGGNCRSPRNVQSSDKANKKSVEEEDKCSEKEARVPEDKCSEKEARVPEDKCSEKKARVPEDKCSEKEASVTGDSCEVDPKESTSSEKSESDKARTVESEVRRDKKPHSENHKFNDKYGYHRPSSSQRGRQGFSRGGYFRQNSARCEDREDFQRGNNSKSIKCDVDSGTGYKKIIDKKEKVVTQELLNNHEGESKVVVVQHKRTSETVHKIGREEKLKSIENNISPSDKKPVSDLEKKMADCSLNHSEQDALKNQGSLRNSHDETNDKKEEANKPDRRHKGRGQRRHAGQDYSDKPKGQGHFIDSQNQGYQRKKDYTAGKRSKDYDDAYDNDDYNDYDYYRQNQTRRGQGYYRGGQRYHNEHRFHEEGFQRGKNTPSPSKKEFKPRSDLGYNEKVLDGHKTEKHVVNKGTSENQSDSKVCNGHRKNSINRGKNITSSHIQSSPPSTDKPVIPQSSGPPSTDKPIIPQSVDSPRNKNLSCDKTESISSGKLNGQPPGFKIKGPPPGFSTKSTKPPPGFHD